MAKNCRRAVDARWRADFLTKRARVRELPTSTPISSTKTSPITGAVSRTVLNECDGGGGNGPRTSLA